MYNVFLSYLRDDKTQALRLARELESNGAVVFVDVDDLLTGTPWREEIAEAIRNAEFFVACFSSTSEKRPDNGMMEELKYVISLRKAGQAHPEILPVKLNACEIPDLQIDSDRNLNELHWCLLDDQNWDASVRQLVEITLRLAKERAKINLKAEAEEVAVKNAQLVEAKEELRTHELRTLRMQRSRETSRHFSTGYSTGYSRGYSTDWSSFELPNVWPAQHVTMKEMEYEQALSQYREHQVEFVKRFGENYHPLSELSDKMDEEARRLHKAFEDARRAEEADIGKELREIMILFVIIAVVGVVIGVLWSWIKSWLGF
jgi:hypothetical protein